MRRSDEIADGQRTDVLKLMNDTSLCPFPADTKLSISEYTRLPLTRLAALGSAFEPLASAVTQAVSGAGGSGLYYVDTGGKTMFQLNGSTEFIGSLKSTAGTVGGGQARMTALACNPAMLFMAAALVGIDKKTPIHGNQAVNKQLTAAREQLGDYRLALYLLSFSSFLEVLLLENYNEEYLNGYISQA